MRYKEGLLNSKRKLHDFLTQKERQNIRFLNLWFQLYTGKGAPVNHSLSYHLSDLASANRCTYEVGVAFDGGETVTHCRGEFG